MKTIMMVVFAMIWVMVMALLLPNTPLKNWLDW